MTSKELAEVLNVSKRTINNKIKKLGIEPITVGNKFDIKTDDIVKIIKNIYPNNYQEFLEKAKIEKSENEKNEENENLDENNKHYQENNEKEKEQNENISENNGKNEQDINAKLIEMLQKSLEDKEETIRRQQNQIDMLIKSNAMLANRLEDKSQKPPQDIIVNEQAAAAAPAEQEKEEVKLHWWQKIFS